VGAFRNQPAAVRVDRRHQRQGASGRRAELAVREYQPRATPLLDAVGHGVALLDKPQGGRRALHRAYLAFAVPVPLAKSWRARPPAQPLIFVQPWQAAYSLVRLNLGAAQLGRQPIECTHSRAAFDRSEIQRILPTLCRHRGALRLAQRRCRKTALAASEPGVLTDLKKPSSPTATRF
jgi:hypothetical protein